MIRSAGSETASNEDTRPGVAGLLCVTATVPDTEPHRTRCSKRSNLKKDKPSIENPLAALEALKLPRWAT